MPDMRTRNWLEKQRLTIFLFEKKGKLLSNDIMNYPTQKNKFINFLKKKIPDTEYEHFCRIKILREFLNEPKFNINHKEYGFLVENNDIHL